ncbi:hypothetical protein LXL04_003058 [Taraxacum kok-saghyz]
MYSGNMGMDSHDMMDIDNWRPRIALSMSYNSGSQPPSIGDVRQFDVSEHSYGIPMDSDGQPPSVTDVGRREASQSEASFTRYEGPDALEVQQHNLELQLACDGYLFNSSAIQIDFNDIPEDPCEQVSFFTLLILCYFNSRTNADNHENPYSHTRNPANDSTTILVPKRRLKLQIRTKISLPVYTGRPISGENNSAVEIALVDAITEQIINTGIESTARLQLVGFRVGTDDSWTFESFLEKVNSEKKGKRILQGNTFLQLKAGVCFVSKISFTHNSENTKNGFYRLGVGVVDAGLMDKVEVARTEAFLMKDGRTTYSEKHPHPRLSDKVCHLLQISYKGNRYRRLKDAGVITVKDLLTHLYTDTKHLQDILKLRASNIWNDIVNNAQASSGMFLYLDPSNQGKTGVVLNAKLQLKGLITEPHNYVPLDHLSAKQKEDNKQLVKYASEHFQTLHSFEDETSLKEYLVLCSNQSFNKSNSHESQTMTQTPTDRGKGIVVYSNQENMSDLESPIGQVNYPTHPSTSYQTAESRVHVYKEMETVGRLRWMNDLHPNIRRGNFSYEDKEKIIQLHSELGNKWSTIAAHLPGRSDDEIKNFVFLRWLLQKFSQQIQHRTDSDLVSLTNTLGRKPSCEKNYGLRKCQWTVEEDLMLVRCINQYGFANWRKLSKYAGFKEVETAAG